MGSQLRAGTNNEGEQRTTTSSNGHPTCVIWQTGVLCSNEDKRLQDGKKQLFKREDEKRDEYSRETKEKRKERNGVMMSQYQQVTVG